MTQAILALVENAEPSNWTTDPAQLNFTDYRNRQLWGPPDQAGRRQCINSALLRKPFSYTVEQRTNPYPNGEDANFGTWEKALDIGRSYLVGSSVPMRVPTGPYLFAERMAAHGLRLVSCQSLSPARAHLHETKPDLSHL
jgi:hypothetical protein